MSAHTHGHVFQLADLHAKQASFDRMWWPNTPVQRCDLNVHVER